MSESLWQNEITDEELEAACVAVETMDVDQTWWGNYDVEIPSPCDCDDYECRLSHHSMDPCIIVPYLRRLDDIRDEVLHFQDFFVRFYMHQPEDESGREAYKEHYRRYREETPVVRLHYEAVEAEWTYLNGLDMYYRLEMGVFL